jgi:hypothetical protein
MFVPCAAGQVLATEDFEDDNHQGWQVNGNELVFDGGNPGRYMGVPLMDFWGITLRNETAAGGLVGDLTGYDSLGLRVDVRVFNLINFFGEQMDPTGWPLVLELVDQGDPEDPTDNVSVYTDAANLPSREQGWATIEYIIPDPSQEGLPSGWRGTGAEDPNTFEPILPPGRTYASVLASVDEVRVTTFVPGFFYTSNFWEVGFDNVHVEALGGGCACDFDGSGTINSADFFAYLTAFFANDPTADFDGSGVVNSADFFAFLGCFFTGC